jgi:TPR repeat protein
MSNYHRFIIIGLALGMWMVTSLAMARTVEDLKNSCNAGYFQDCLNLALVYEKGAFKEVKAKKNAALAKQYIKRGIQMGEDNCNSGVAKDCYYIGHIFFEGGMVPTDMPRGLQYIQRSCQHGYKKACEWLDNSGLGRR